MYGMLPFMCCILFGMVQNTGMADTSLHILLLKCSTSKIILHLQKWTEIIFVKLFVKFCINCLLHVCLFLGQESQTVLHADDQMLIIQKGSSFSIQTLSSLFGCKKTFRSHILHLFNFVKLYHERWLMKIFKKLIFRNSIKYAFRHWSAYCKLVTSA